MSNPDNTTPTAYGLMDSTALTELRGTFDTSMLLRMVDELAVAAHAAEGEDSLRESVLRLHDHGAHGGEWCGHDCGCRLRDFARTCRIGRRRDARYDRSFPELDIPIGAVAQPGAASLTKSTEGNRDQQSRVGEKYIKDRFFITFRLKCHFWLYPGCTSKWLSNDLGAVAGFLFDIGSGRYSLGAPSAIAFDWEADLARVHEETAAAHKARLAASENDHTHTQVQGWLRDLGLALGFKVWIANNDKGRAYGDGRLGDGCVTELPAPVRASGALDMVALIDVLWLDAASGNISMAFEVEHSTSIYSGIVRMLDLALGVPEHEGATFFLVAPDAREADVRSQFARPAFSRVKELNVRYIGYGELARHREAIGRFGDGEKAILAISKPLAC